MYESHETLILAIHCCLVSDELIIGRIIHEFPDMIALNVNDRCVTSTLST